MHLQIRKRQSRFHRKSSLILNSKTFPQKKILLTIPANVTVGASDDQQIQENGKKALSGQSTVEIEQMAREIVSEEFTLAISMITIEDINRNKKWFLDHCTDIIDKKLNTIGLQVLDIDVIDITDSAGVIEEMGAKAVAEHTAQHGTGPVDINTISWEIENSTELMIEKLEQSRLSSEADAIIADCYEHLCALKKSSKLTEHWWPTANIVVDIPLLVKLTAVRFQPESCSQPMQTIRFSP